jgi:hypothetical protein
MSSYVNRLAQDVCLSVRTLIVDVISPEIGLITGGVTQFAYVDGATSATERFVSAVERLTGLKNLKRLTLGSVSPLSSLAGEHRQYVSYCPLCLEFSLEKHGECFIPLVWSLRSYCVCIKHQKEMLMRCHHCGATELRSMFSGSRNGCCFKCKRWLGAMTCHYSEIGNPEMLERSVCAAELVEAASSGRGIVDTRKLIADLLYERMDGNVSMLARAMNTSIERTVRMLVYRSSPSISEWMALSRLANRSVAELVTVQYFPKVALPNRRVLIHDILRSMSDVVNSSAL